MVLGERRSYLPTQNGYFYGDSSGVNRPFSKMAAENSNKSKLKTNTSTRKSTLTLVNLPSFRISGETSPEKIYVENCKIYRRLYDWGYKAYPQSYKRL